MTDRLSLLKQAAFRAQQAGRCRICKGNVFPDKPYCIRHFRMLDGGGFLRQLAHDVSEGRQLEEADAIIRVRDQFPKVNYANCMNLTPHLGLQRRAMSWILTLSDGSTEKEIGEFPTLLAALRKVLDNRQAYSTHNRYATKALIR